MTEVGRGPVDPDFAWNSYAADWYGLLNVDRVEVHSGAYCRT
ncbi:hypothetical protein [Streptomyces sp. NPDC048508]